MSIVMKMIKRMTRSIFRLPKKKTISCSLDNKPPDAFLRYFSRTIKEKPLKRSTEIIILKNNFLTLKGVNHTVVKNKECNVRDLTPLLLQWEDEVDYIKRQAKEGIDEPGYAQDKLEIILNDSSMILERIRQELGYHHGLVGPV